MPASALADPPLVVIQAGKAVSRLVAEAVLSGFVPGGSILVEPKTIPDTGLPVLFGAWPTTARWLHRWRRESRPFVYIDNAYYQPTNTPKYFRVVLNGLQAALPDLAPSAKRGAALRTMLGPAPDPKGRDIVMWLGGCARWRDMFHIPVDAAEPYAVAAAAEMGLRVVARPRPKSPKDLLRDSPDLSHCALVVGCGSMGLIEAHLRGIPTFCVSSHSLAGALNHAIPTYGRRRKTLMRLASGQFTLQEISNGEAARHLASRVDWHFHPLC